MTTQPLDSLDKGGLSRVEQVNLDLQTPLTYQKQKPRWAFFLVIQAHPLGFYNFGR
jgi:hypothetical protein